VVTFLVTTVLLYGMIWLGIADVVIPMVITIIVWEALKGAYSIVSKE
jgi:hypothetical protein